MLIRRDVLKLTAPIILEQTFVMSMGIINTIMASQIGKEAVSAIGLVDSVNNILIAVFLALSIGGTVVVAQLCGQGKIKTANEAVKQILYTGVLITLVITFLIWAFKGPVINGLFGSADPVVKNLAETYLKITVLTYPLIAIQLIVSGALRGSGNTRTPMNISIMMNIFNIILSYTLIYGVSAQNVHFHFSIPALGVTGAALGISAARLAGAAVSMIILIRGSGFIRLKKLFRFRLNISLLKSIFGIGIPVSLESLLFNGGKLITQVFIVSFGTAAIASNSIASSILSVFCIPGNAIGTAATTLVGQNIGKGDIGKAKQNLIYLTIFSTISMVTIGGIAIPFSKVIPLLFTQNAEIIKITASLIVINSIFTIVWSLSFVIPAGLKGAGDAKYTLVTSVIGMWVFRIILGYILGITLKLGVEGVWLGMFTDWTVRGILYAFRLKGEKWHRHAVAK
jgi:putative MATE family efflux protein